MCTIQDAKTNFTAYEDGILYGTIIGHIDTISDLASCGMSAMGDAPRYNYAYTDADVQLNITLPLREAKKL